MAVWNDCASQYTDKIMAKTGKLTTKNMPDTRAKRGDFAITLHEKSMRGNTYTVCVVSKVTSVDRNGFATRLAPISSTAAPMRKGEWKLDKILLLKPEKLVDPVAFEMECKARQTPDPDTFKPFASFEDVRETARKYL